MGYDLTERFGHLTLHRRDQRDADSRNMEIFTFIIARCDSDKRYTLFKSACKYTELCLDVMMQIKRERGGACDTILLVAGSGAISVFSIHCVCCQELFRRDQSNDLKVIKNGLNSIEKESRTDVQFHLAALRGDCERLRQLLDTGKVHIDSRDRVSGQSRLPRNYWKSP
ncbi:hypothetical protein MSG28_003196 [Choristoneura fumiferana]|uniref:Uncharacterized protein n=1 Tax=Choristoneura fumiferana TaxID=7141 RepID=A0ACC0KE66_CHOFU|nr:hypothetical protein MSG28_003196 [Choristoneura fumiferana]